MDAIVLVGGQGTRLRPLTLTRHKSLVPICNQPLIEHLFAWVDRSGFERAVLAIGRGNDDLAEAYAGGRPGGLRVELVLEHERLESGGAIRHAVREAGVSGRFTVLNGDLYLDFDFRAALAAHEARSADLTMALYEVDQPSMYGVAVVDSGSMITGFVEKPPPGTEPSHMINAGAWIFEPGLVDEIPPGAVRVEETLFPSLVARRRPVLGFQIAGPWADVGTPSRYLQINRHLAALAGGAVVAGSARVPAGVRVLGSSVGADCKLSEGSEVLDSVLWERVTVGAEASVRESILADGVHVGERATLDGVVAGSGAIIAPGANVRTGTLIEPGARYDA